MGRHDFDGRTDLRKAALKRRSDAWVLLRAGRDHARAAMYLGGCAIECKLKAIAMEVHDVWTLRDLARVWRVSEDEVYSHGLEALLEHLPALRDRLREGPVWRRFAGFVNKWRASWRYNPWNAKEAEAKTFLEAVDSVYKWLEANRF
jgi:hypothetical protein